jgi:hypothetical protein
MRKLIAIAVLACCACFPAAADAAGPNVWQLFGPIVSRSGINPKTGMPAHSQGFMGPQGHVGVLGTTFDDYACPSDVPHSAGAVVVGTDFASEVSSWKINVNTDAGFNQIQTYGTNWSFHTINIRTVAACTDDLAVFPKTVIGDYEPIWQFYLSHPPVTIENYATLIQRALCWDPGFLGCGGAVGSAAAARPAVLAGSAVASQAAVSSRRARKRGNRFALHDGTNKIALNFKVGARSRRPPAVFLAGAQGCRASKMRTRVINADGVMELDLRCRGLERRATARVRIGKAIHRSFPLHQGVGTLRVHLDKPPGKVEPYVFLTDGRAGSSCRSLSHRLRLRPRTLDLRVRARCGKVGRHATGHLYVGGLLTP